MSKIWKSDLERFNSKYIPEPMSGCWIWITHNNEHRYGVFQISISKGKQKSILAHRYSWEIFNNKKIPKGLCVLHKCDTPECINPRHLFIGTQQENIKDMHLKKRHVKAYTYKQKKEKIIKEKKVRTHCDKGHEYIEGSYYFLSKRRQCKKCTYLRYKKAKEKKLLNQTSA